MQELNHRKTPTDQLSAGFSALKGSCQPASRQENGNPDELKHFNFPVHDYL
jgi:hypothetical protein